MTSSKRWSLRMCRVTPMMRDSAPKCVCGHAFSLHQKRWGTTACGKSTTSEVSRPVACGCGRYEGAER